MKTTLIHGQDKDASYENFTKCKESLKSKQIRVFNTKSDQSLSEFFRSQDLFTSSSVYIIENFDKLKSSEIKWLYDNSNQYDYDLILYSEKEISKSVIDKLPKPIQIKQFEYPKVIWNFLDSIYPGNSKKCLILMGQLSETEPIEKTFTLVINQIKDLYLSKINPQSLGYPIWRMNKIKSQSDRFATKQLETIICGFAEVDKQSKLGGDLNRLLSFELIRCL